MENLNDCPIFLDNEKREPVDISDRPTFEEWYAGEEATEIMRKRVERRERFAKVIEDFRNSSYALQDKIVLDAKMEYYLEEILEYTSGANELKDLTLDDYARAVYPDFVQTDGCGVETQYVESFSKDVSIFDLEEKHLWMDEPPYMPEGYDKYVFIRSTPYIMMRRDYEKDGVDVKSQVVKLVATPGQIWQYHPPDKNNRIRISTTVKPKSEDEAELKIYATGKEGEAPPSLPDEWSDNPPNLPDEDEIKAKQEDEAEQRENETGRKTE